ncbi:MAG TPA: PSD1 and planctomycete cytochrome C domain-containing protein, partial [Gemmataceae bacterium]|nr:PSD1 and planctomycete cytochrome C domain-containing protein [Gemmataceae bacterium]
MRAELRRAVFFVLAGTALLVPAARAAERPDAAGVEFFETKIRPVLADQCYRCHSAQAKKVKGRLLLDSRAGVLKGGESGPAVVPGKPADSLLVKAVRHADDAPAMPPKGKLSDAVLADFERWVAVGAPMPADSKAQAARVAGPPHAEEGRRHWAFQPIRDVTPPAVKNAAWTQSPVDRFVLAKLEAGGLSPSPQAGRRTLLRRATIDLTGLPPTPAEMDAFLADRSPDAFARVVDRLLASSAYGERWGRHWLDVARYADSKDGVLMYGDDRIRPYAYTYRDYVIAAFNDDLPFDRFVQEQLAADQIEPTVEPRRLAAMGFLTLGRMFDGNIHDVIDDRIDTVSRGLLGLTVGCARCHDHKYDPIPQADYYSLYGVFASSEQPLVPPLMGRPQDFPGCAKFEKVFGPKRDAVQKMLDSQFALLSETARRRTPDYLVHVATTKPDPLETAIFFLSLAPEDLRPPITARWRTYLERRARPDDPVFGPWHDLFALPEAELPHRAAEVLQAWKARSPGTEPGQVNPLVLQALCARPLTSRADVARAYGDLLVRVHEQSKSAAATDGPHRQLLEVLTAHDSPAYFPKSLTRNYMSRTEKDAFGAKVEELDRIAVKSPNAPPRAMVLTDAPALYDPHIFIRGNPSRPGESVPRRFLWVIQGDHRRPFAHGSGRLDLARAITAPDNPLTTRVIVNRVWMWHFGEPLVDTPNDFGLRSNSPTNPELLDYLATRLRRDGWSLKKLHRLLMLSSAYQQASFDRPDCRRVDPDNRLLWRMNRQRLDFEAMRDTLLAVSGRLENRVGGRPVDVAGDPLCRRRTVYGMVDRQNLPALFRAFDFASPDQSAERRPQTTVPQQALFGMNAPFVIEQARALA